MDNDYIIRERIRNNLIELRIENHLSQQEIGDICGKSLTAVASWEQGLSLPNITTLYRLAKYYGKTLDYMYGEEKNES